jgi:hypothetical protein
MDGFGETECEQEKARSTIVMAGQKGDNQTELFGWHRVTCYGEYRKQLIDLATLYGLDVIEEDR